MPGAGNELAFGIAGALFGCELVSTVRCTDRNSQRVAAGTGCEVDNFLRISVCVVVGRYFVFYACENTEFTFDSYVELVSIIYYLLGQSNVFFVGKVATVDHNRRETEVDAALAEFEAVTVVEVQNDLGILPAKFFLRILQHP